MIFKKNSNARAEISKLHGWLNSCEQSRAREGDRALRQENDRLKKDNAELRHAWNKLRGEDEISKLKRQICDADAEIYRLSTYVQNIDPEINRLRFELHEAHNKLARVKEETQTNREWDEGEINRLRSLFENSETALKARVADCVRLQAEANMAKLTLKREIEESEPYKEIRKLNKHIYQLATQIEGLTNKNTKLEAEVNELETQLDRIKELCGH